MQSLTNAQRQLINKVATKNSFSEYEVECESGSLKGDNYLGFIVSVVVKENNRRMNLILKASKPTEAIPVHSVYMRETAMYREVLKEFDNFQKKYKPVYPFKGYAKFYGAGEEIDQEFLLLDNLKAQGYKMWDRKLPMNSAHITCGIKEYAKLHSLSFAMRKKHPDKMKEFEVLLTDIFMADFSPERLECFYNLIITRCLNLVKDNKIALEAIEKFASCVADYYTKDLADPSLQLVVTHGDCWCNNILFHYKVSCDRRKMEELSSAERSLIHEIATNNEYSEYELECKSGSQKGDNYLGIITCVTIKNYDKRLDVILKSSKPSETIPIHNAFLREINFYEQIITEFEKIQTQFKPSHPFQAYAKFYGACKEEGNECLVIEDLKPKSFQMWNRKMPMNNGHLTATFKEYAKMHSLSFAIKDKYPEKFRELTEHLNDIFDAPPDRWTKYFEALIDRTLEIVEKNTAGVNAIRAFRSNFKEYYEIILNPDLKLVITHGDCWCNNILYKYENPDDTSEPEKVCFIDWQISKYGSPASDLVYFLFASSDKENLYNYKTYLRCYHDVLSENLRSMGCDPEELYPYSMLEKHFKLHAKFGLNLAIMILRVIMCEMEEAPDLTNIKKDSDFSDVLNFKSIHEEAYKQRILDLVLFMVDNDLF